AWPRQRVRHLAGLGQPALRQTRRTAQTVPIGQTAWINVVADFNADPTNASDSTQAFKNALSALASAGGGVLYIPAGEYMITSTLPWTSGHSLMILGDGEDASMINRASAIAPFHTFDIQNSGGVTVQNLN